MSTLKVLLSIDGGFSKTLFEGDKKGVEDFLKGFQYARNKNLQSPEAIGVLKEVVQIAQSMNPESEAHSFIHWGWGATSAIENTKGKLEVVE